MQWLIIGFCSLRKVDMSLLSLSSSTLFFKSKTSVNKTTIPPIRTSFSVTFPSLLSALLPNLIRALLKKSLYISHLVSYYFIAMHTLKSLINEYSLNPNWHELRKQEKFITLYYPSLPCITLNYPELPCITLHYPALP